MISEDFWSGRTQKVVDLEIEDGNSANVRRRPRASCPKRQNCALNRPRGHVFWHFFKIHGGSCRGRKVKKDVISWYSDPRYPRKKGLRFCRNTHFFALSLCRAQPTNPPKVAEMRPLRMDSTAILPFGPVPFRSASRNRGIAASNPKSSHFLSPS